MPGLKYQSRTPHFRTLTGPTGSGKTHRLRALEREHAQARPGSQVLRVSADELLALLLYALREEVPEVFRRLPDRGFSLVLIDDLDPARLGRRTRIEFARLLSAFVQSGTRLVVGLAACARVPEGEGEDEDAADALWALLATAAPTRLRGPDLRARMRLARDRARELGVALGWVGRLKLAWQTGPDAGLIRGSVNQWMANAL